MKRAGMLLSLLFSISAHAQIITLPDCPGYFSGTCRVTLSRAIAGNLLSSGNCAYRASDGTVSGAAVLDVDHYIHPDGAQFNALAETQASLTPYAGCFRDDRAIVPGELLQRHVQTERRFLRQRFSGARAIRHAGAWRQWRSRDHDGRSHPNEISRLEVHQIVSLKLDRVHDHSLDANGNGVMLVGSYVRRHGDRSRRARHG
jgi:hypothetical protein